MSINTDHYLNTIGTVSQPLSLLGNITIPLVTSGGKTYVDTGISDAGTANVTNGTRFYFINQAFSMSGIYVNLSLLTPVDGQLFTICTNYPITSMTFNGASYVNPPTGLTANSYATFIYVASIAKWVRCG